MVLQVLSLCLANVYDTARTTSQRWRFDAFFGKYILWIMTRTQKNIRNFERNATASSTRKSRIRCTFGTGIVVKYSQTSRHHPADYRPAYTPPCTHGIEPYVNRKEAERRDMKAISKGACHVGKSSILRKSKKQVESPPCKGISTLHYHAIPSDEHAQSSTPVPYFSLHPLFEATDTAR